MRILYLCFLFFSSLAFSIEKYFATTSDSEHFNWLVLQIESIFEWNREVEEIAVFDIGLTKKQRDYLSAKPEVVVLDLEEVNPYMKTEFQVRPNGRISRGWYSWKPVAIKQALERYPYLLFLDAGISVKAPLDRLFEHIVQNGYFFLSAGHELSFTVTNAVKNHFHLTETFLKQQSISSGVQGITKALQEAYVKPIYECSKKIELFEDDGSSTKGFGWGRHDQVISSIFVLRNRYKIHSITQGDYLHIDDEDVPFNIFYFFQFKPT